MAQPTPYARSFDFTQFSTDTPSAQQPGVRLDAEFDGLGETLGETLDNLALIQRDDGQLRNASVRLATLHSEVIAALTLIGASITPWATATSYTAGQIVTNADDIYMVGIAHTSGVLATDLAANKLIRIFDSGLGPDLSASTGTTLIGHDLSGTTTPRPLSEHLNNETRIFVEDYKYDGIIVRTDKERVLASLADWLTLGGAWHWARGKEYDFGNQAVSASLITIYNPKDCSTIEGNGATIKTTTTANAYYNVLYAVKYKNLTIRNLNYTDAGFLTQVGLGHVGSAGGKFIVIDNDGVSENNGLTLENCYANEALAFLSCQGDEPANRTQNIYIAPNCRAKNVFYVLSFQNNGDGVRGGITAVNPGRVYFLYGVTNHDLDIKVSHDGIASGATSLCLIKRYAHDTTGIRLRLAVSGSMAAHNTLVTCEHSNVSGSASRIDGVDVEINVAPGTTDTVPTRRLHFSSIDADVAPFIFNTGNVAHVSTNVKLRGNLGNSTVPHVRADYTATSPCLIDVSGAIFGYSLVQTVDAPGFVIRTAPDTYVFEKYGDLTSGVISIPMPGLDAKVALFEIDIAAEKTSIAATSGASTKMHRYCDTVGIKSESNTVAIITGSPIAAIPATAFNSSNLTRAYAGNGSALEITLAGSDYAVGTAFARVTVRALSRKLMR